jgi:peptidoglycan/LPS O-acetylase OafA/YrhL
LKNTIHFSGLNGLRAIAALAVLFSHTTHALTDFGLDSFLFGKYPDGNPKTTLLAGFGVSIFFALSGFLITFLLLEEKKTGDIAVRKFYIRRVLRIWPLYYLYLGLCVLTFLLLGLPFEKGSLFFYTFLMANVPFVFGGALPLLEHYWSLGVEEQFYSFWPWVVRTRKSLLLITVVLCLALLGLKFFFRFWDIRVNGGEMGWPYMLLHVTRFHCMLMGAIGAILFSQRNKLFLWLTDNFVTQAIAWLVILLAAVNKFHVASFLDNEVIAVVTVFLIIGQIRKDHRLINLEIPVFDFVGKISYGIYVIHPLVIFYLAKMISFPDKASYLQYGAVYVIVFAVTLFISYLSYRFFEKRFLVLKEKYVVVQSS